MYSFENPTNRRILVKIIGSKKKPMLPIKRLDTVGKEIAQISFNVR